MLSASPPLNAPGATPASRISSSAASRWRSCSERESLLVVDELSEGRLRRGTHRELVASIRTRITDWNENPRPFVWHKNADQILESLVAYRERISELRTLGGPSRNVLMVISLMGGRSVRASLRHGGGTAW